MIYEYLKKNMLKFQDSTLEDELNCVTYLELLERAECLGKTLDHHKYGILCKSELYTAIALLACFYAKKTAVLLSSRYGEKHNQKIIDRMGVSHLITEDGVRILSKATKECEDLSDVALIMSTSGTTGNPKGAMITYENLLTNLKDIDLYLSIGNTDRILIARPLYHCAVLTGEFLLALIKGADIIFLNSKFSPVTILQAIRRQNITVFCGTPTILYHLCRTIMRQTESCPLKTVVVSGECMTEIVAQRLRDVLPFANIYHVYGLTEASPRVSYLPPELFDKYPLSVGLPLRSVKVKTVGGELFVKGKSIMKGYYNNSDNTRVVIKNGWLHTGDMAEIDNSGMITIKSRKDDMIIRAGINVYPQEIENMLKQDQGISDILVYGARDGTVGEKIHFKVVSDTLSKSEVFTLCCNLLPSYQLPDSIEIVDEIPKNASGKVIRSGSL